MGHSLGGTIVLWILADPVLRRQFPEVIGAVDGVVLLAPVDLTARPDFDGSVFDQLAHVSGLEICLADVSGALREQAAVGARESVVDPRRAAREDADWAVEILRDTGRRRAMQAMLLQADPAAQPSLDRI